MERVLLLAIDPGINQPSVCNSWPAHYELQSWPLAERLGYPGTEDIPVHPIGSQRPPAHWLCGWAKVDDGSSFPQVIIVNAADLISVHQYRVHNTETVLYYHTLYAGLTVLAFTSGP